MKKMIVASLVAATVAGSMTSYAASKPRRVAADQHIKVVQYDPNNVVMLQGRYGYQTQITFAPNETIQSVSLGDSLAWQAVPVANNLFIKPVTSSITNMTVLTNQNSYNFQLDSQNPSVSPTYKLQFRYGQESWQQGNDAGVMSSVSPDKLNWKYTFTGDRALAPITAFDDGQFTWLKFKTDGMSHTPAVFMVDKNRKESLVNYHMQGDYMVINAVGKQFTLRDGDVVTSVYNDLAIGDWNKV